MMVGVFEDEQSSDQAQAVLESWGVRCTVPGHSTQVVPH